MVALVSVTTGFGFTVTLATAVDEQPWAEVAVTLYGKVPAVVSAAVVADALPGAVAVSPAEKVYVYVPAAATLADKVAVVPAQIVALVSVTTGFGFTVTLAVAVDEHPSALVAVTLYG